MRAALLLPMWLLIAVASSGHTVAVAAERLAASATTDAPREIAALIAAIGASSCRFERNGTWYDAATASTHLQRKYDYLRKRAPVTTAEQFIERAASRSSVTGQAYRVRCSGAAEVDASVWFAQTLQRLRAKKPSPATR